MNTINQGASSGEGRTWTPGPWKVGIWNGDKNRKHVVDMLGASKTTFAMLTDRSSMFPPSAIVHSDGDRCEVEANARLIAAAPDLFEAARLFVEEYDAGELDDGVDLMLAYNRALEAAKAALAKAIGQ